MPNEPHDEIMDAPPILTDGEQARADEAHNEPDNELVPGGEEPTGDEHAEGDEPTTEGPRLFEDEGEEEGEDEDAEAAAREKEEEAHLSDEEKAQRKLEKALDEPIPQDLSKRTQERIRTLIDSTREASEKFQATEGQLNSITGALRTSGVTPDMFKAYVDVNADFNSNEPARQERGFKWLLGVVQDMSDRFGFPINLQHPVERHPDLLADYQAKKITLERATELALGRNRAAAAGRYQNNNQPANDPAEHERAVTAARKELDQFEERMKRSDPDYDRKADFLIEQLKSTFAVIHPSEWRARFEKAYRNLKASALPPDTSRRPNGRQRLPNQPMRHGKRPAGGARRQPGGLEDAISDAIDNAHG